MTEMLPREVASAAGLKYLGFDPADVDEAIAFVDMSNPAAPPAYGLTLKFNKPIRGSAIPQRTPRSRSARRTERQEIPAKPAPDAAQLLRTERSERSSSHPMRRCGKWSKPRGKATTGPILDRVRDVPAGSDLYVAIDVATLRPLIQMAMAQARAQAPPDVQPLLDAPNLIAAAELT